MIKYFQKVHTGAHEDQRMQSNLQGSISSLLNNPLADGRLLESVSLVSGTNQLSHKLNRKIRGYIIVKQNASAAFYCTSDDDKFLNLTSSANVTASLYIF